MRDELGVTEKHVVTRLDKAVIDSLKYTKDLLHELEKLEDLNWAGLMNDSSKKEIAIVFLDNLEKLNYNIEAAIMLPMMANLLIGGLTKE